MRANGCIVRETLPGADDVAQFYFFDVETG